MLLTVQEMGTLLKTSVDLLDSDLGLSDDELLLYIKLGVTRMFPDVSDLSDLPDGSEYAIVLLAKIELYTALAARRADKVDLGADNNNYIKLSHRFEHYMSLVDKTKDQYDDWLENEGAEVLGLNVVSTYDVILSGRHYSSRNYTHQQTPKVKIIVDQITTDTIEFHWKLSQSSFFSRFKVYVGTVPVIDVWSDGATYKNKIVESAKLVKSTGDIRDCYHRLSGLIPDTNYYIAVVSIERNQVFGYAQILVPTLKEESDEEDVSVETVDEP